MLGREATRALLRHKPRSGLPMLGITIGITAVVLVVAIGQAGKQKAEEALSRLATTWCGSRLARATWPRPDVSR